MAKRYMPLVSAGVVVLIALAFMLGKHMSTVEIVSPTNKDTVGAFNDGWIDGQTDIIEQMKSLGECANPVINQDEKGRVSVTCED
jgi:hypothetical protein